MKEPTFAYCKVDFAICWRFGEILSFIFIIGNRSCKESSLRLMCQLS